jgi:hypothetical protein
MGAEGKGTVNAAECAPSSLGSFDEQGQHGGMRRRNEPTGSTNVNRPTGAKLFVDGCTFDKTEAVASLKKVGYARDTKLESTAPLKPWTGCGRSAEDKSTTSVRPSWVAASSWIVSCSRPSLAVGSIRHSAEKYGPCTEIRCHASGIQSLITTGQRLLPHPKDRLCHHSRGLSYSMGCRNSAFLETSPHYPPLSSEASSKGHFCRSHWHVSIQRQRYWGQDPRSVDASTSTTLPLKHNLPRG